MMQIQLVMGRLVKGFVTTASILVFSVSLASGNDMTTAPVSGTPYNYSDPASTAPSYNDVGRPVDEETSSLILNNQTLGLSGPVTVSGGYSANYGYELNTSFSHMLGFYDAISLLGAYAPQENRIDITWAHAWTEKQRTKLSVERLSEEMDFDYDSGTATEWVPQYSYGAGYQYLFNKNWLKNVELSGYYAQAQSQDLSTVRFQDDSGTYDNYRHIAGATSEGSEATLNISPWKTGLVGLGLNYDSVNYDTKYEDTDAEDAKGFGFTLSLEQLLSKHVKLDLEGSQREVYDDYVAGVSFLTPVNLEVGVNGERTLGENGSSSDSRFNLNLAYFFDDKNRYENGYNLEDASQSDLAAWASKSVAYMDEVLAAADQRTVRIVGDSQESDSNNALKTADTTPVLTLTVGEINHVSIATYIESSNLTESQKQATPTITGGPTDVEFTYDSSTQSLVTKAEVPASVADKESAPLVVVFPADAENASDATLIKGTLRDALTDKLTFKVTVGASTAPTLNPAFVSAQAPILNHAQTWVFNYENISQPAGPADLLTMFLNGNATSPYLVMDSHYPQITGDTNKCYTTVANNSASVQTFTVTGKASAVCPGNATIKVVTDNVNSEGKLAFSSPVQTITFTALPASTPFISGGAITSPTILSGAAYTPGHTFTSDEVSPGQSATFNTNTSATYLKVFDTNGGGCADVTSASNLSLGFANGDTQTILQSTAAIPASLSGHALKIYLHVANMNTPAGTADNGTTSGCKGTPFTATVQGAPIVPGDLNMNIPVQPTVDTSYSYNFTANGVTSGSAGGFTSGTATTKIANSDGSETAVDIAALGLTLNVSPTSVTMTGIPAATYAGDTIHVYLNVTNADGYSNGNTVADYFTILANPTEAPVVGTGAVNDVNVTENYTSSVLTGTTSGTGRSYAGVNTISNAGTYAKVADVNGNDVTDLANVNLTNNGQTLTLQSNGSAVASTLSPGQYNVYVHVYNDANVASSNCSDTACSALTSGSPYTLDVHVLPSVAGNQPLTDGAQYAAYTYAFPNTGTNAVTAGVNNAAFNTTATYAVITAPDGVTSFNTQTNGSPFTLAFSSNDTQVTLNGVAGEALTQKGKWTVALYVTNADAQTANNADSVDYFNVTSSTDPAYQPQVAGGLALTNGVQYTDYTTYTFATTDVYAGAAGSNETFKTDSASTYAVVTDPNGTSYSTATAGSPFALAFSNGDTQIALNGVAGQALTVQGPWTVVLHVTNKDGATAFNATADTFTVSPNSAYDPQVVTTGVPLNNAVINGASSVAYDYSYTTSPMLPGPAEDNAVFDTTQTKALVYYATDAAKSNPLPGFSLVFNAGHTAITNLQASATTVQSLAGPVNVYYQAVNTTNSNDVVTSTNADTVGTDKIDVATTTLSTATVAIPYSYDFAANDNLALGSTGIDAANSTVTFSDPDAGLTAEMTLTDIVISGTPVAGHSNSPLTVTLNVKTPDVGGLSKQIVVTVPMVASTPIVIAGDLPTVQLNQTYNYPFANTGSGGATGPVVSAGAGEYFDEDATTFTVTGKSGNNETSLFHLEYSSNASLEHGNAASHDHNVVSLVSNGALTSADTLTVSFHVVNADAQNVNGTPGTISVGSVTGYLVCPDAAAMGNSRPTQTYSNLYSAPTGGSILDAVTFNRQAYDGSDLMVLYGAYISVAGNQTTLTCKYNNPTTNPSPFDYISTTVIETVDANGVQGVGGTGWNSTTSPTQCTTNGSPTATSCQVAYTYSG